MSYSIQTNKEFVDAAGIDERDAFIAITIRRIVAKMTEIPAQELIADMTFEDLMKRRGEYVDWDEICFLIELEEIFNVGIDMETGWEEAKKAGYPNWFYNPDNYKQFSFFWKPFYPKVDERKISFGEWIKLAVEVVLVPIREKLISPDDWPGLESSDLESDAIAQKSPSHNAQFYLFWGVMIVTGVILLLFGLALYAGGR